MNTTNMDRKFNGILAAISLALFASAAGPESAGAENLEKLRSEAGFSLSNFPPVEKFSSLSHRSEFPPRDEDIETGWELAAALCRTFESSGGQECEAIVRRSRHFSWDAVLACGRTRADSEKLRCIDVIADHEISSAEARHCAESVGKDRYIVDCLEDVVRRDNPTEPEGPWDRPGLNEASRLCSSMRYVEDSRHCMTAIFGARYFPLAGVKVCAARYHDQNKTACLMMFRDKYLSPLSLLVCSDMKYNPDRHADRDGAKIDCLLGGASDNRFDQGPWQDQRGVQSAVDLCRSLRDENRKGECTRVLGSARHFSLEAVNVCYEMISDGYKIECLGAVKDSTIGGDAARACLRIKYEPNKIACLRNLAGR